MAKEKLLVTASTFPRWENDTEPRFVLDLCKALERYFDVTVLVPACPGAEDEEVLEGIKVIRYHYFPIHKFETLCYPGAIVPRIKEKKIRILLVPCLFLGLWIKLLKILPQYDFVHAHWLIPQGIVQSFFRKKYIVTGHGSDVVSLNKEPILTLKKRTLKRAGTVAVVSKHLENVVKDMCPSANTTVLPMGCWTDNFGPEYRKENYFQQNGKKVILFVGRLTEQKGVNYLIEAMKHIDGKLVIVGKGNAENELKRLASEQQEKILFLGPKTHEELKTIYASADIFVAPSITAKKGGPEGFGLVLLEAMASGLPVIASNSGGIRDIIISGENGILVEEKNVEQIINAINKIMCDLEKENDFWKEKSIATAKKYDYNKIALQYSKLIKGCVMDK